MKKLFILFFVFISIAFANVDANAKGNEFDLDSFKPVSIINCEFRRGKIFLARGAVNRFSMQLQQIPPEEQIVVIGTADSKTTKKLNSQQMLKIQSKVALGRRSWVIKNVIKKYRPDLQIINGKDIGWSNAYIYKRGEANVRSVLVYWFVPKDESPQIIHQFKTKFTELNKKYETSLRINKENSVNLLKKVNEIKNAKTTDWSGNFDVLQKNQQIVADFQADRDSKISKDLRIIKIVSLGSTGIIVLALVLFFLRNGRADNIEAVIQPSEKKASTLVDQKDKAKSVNYSLVSDKQFPEETFEEVKFFLKNESFIVKTKIINGKFKHPANETLYSSEAKYRKNIKSDVRRYLDWNERGCDTNYFELKPELFEKMCKIAELFKEETIKKT